MESFLAAKMGSKCWLCQDYLFLVGNNNLNSPAVCQRLISISITKFAFLCAEIE